MNKFDMDFMAFQDKDISSLIMTLKQRVSINKWMRKDALSNFLWDKIINHEITDKEVTKYCENCHHIGFVFMGTYENGNLFHHIILSSIFYRHEQKLIHGNIVARRDSCFDWNFQEDFILKIDFNCIPTESNLLKILDSWQCEWGERSGMYSLFYIRPDNDVMDRNNHIRYDLLTVHNILTSIYSSYLIECPEVSIMIEDKICNYLLEYELGMFEIIKVSREIFEATSNISDSIVDIFDWIDTL